MCNTLPPGHETTVFGRPFLFNITIFRLFDIFPGKKENFNRNISCFLTFFFVSFYIFYHKSMSILIEYEIKKLRFWPSCFLLHD